MTRSYGRGARLLVVENVPVLVCPHCGESYLTAHTLHLLDRIKRHRQRLAAPKRVAVARFTHGPSSEVRGLTNEWSRRAADRRRRAAHS